MTTSFKKVIIDADQMIYACGFASEGEPRSHTYRLLNNAIEKIIKDTGASEHEIYIEGDGNFREEVSFDYKAQRSSRKPESFVDCQQFLIERWGAKQVEGMETDDQVSMKLWHNYVSCDEDPEECDIILSSPDKDLNNTPGWHYNPRTRKIQWINKHQSFRHFWFQVLRGDPVDNVPGLPYCTEDIRKKFSLPANAAKGCGEASAKKIMKAEGDEVENVMHCYAAWGVDQGKSEEQTRDYLSEQMCLLWMLRELDEFGEPVHPSLNHTLFHHVWKEYDDSTLEDTVEESSDD